MADRQPTYRMSMLPLATYPNDSGHGEHLEFAMPGMIQEPINALVNLFGTPSHPGTFGQGPDYPGNADDMRTLLMSTYGGNALNPGRMLEGAAASEIGPSLLSDTGKPSLPGAIVTGAETNTPLRASTSPQTWYHGSPYEFDNFDLGEVAARRGYTNNGFAGISFAPSRREAASYGPNVIRARTNVSNPFVWNLDDFPNTLERARQIYPDIDQSVRDMDFPVGNRWEFAQALKNAGHDALDINLDGRTNERVVFDPANLTLFSDTSKPSIMGSALAGAEANAPIRAYRGKTDAEALFPDPPSPDKLYTGLPEMIWASSHPEVADTYAGAFNGKPGMDAYSHAPVAGAVAPVDMNFSNPMVVDAQGRAWNDIPFNGNWTDSNALSSWARDLGHDGLVIKNVLDHLGGRGKGSPAPADTVVALKRGTVTSPLTGETLFSDTGKPSLMGSAVAGAEQRGGGPSLDFYDAFAQHQLQPGQSVHATYPDDASRFLSRFNHGGDSYEAAGSFSPDNTAYLDWIGKEGILPEDLYTRANGVNTLGRAALRQWRDSFLQQFPDVKQFSGERVSGGRYFNEAADPIQTVSALFSDTGLPSLLGSALNQNQPPRNALWDY